MPRLFRAGAAATAVAAAVTGLTLLAPVAEATASTPTAYGLSGQGYGLSVDGGALPVASGDLAKVNSGCTNLAGISAANDAAAVNLPNSLGKIGAMSTKSWTSTTADGTVNRYSQTEVAGIQLGGSTVGLKIDGLKSLARVWHNSSGFHYSVSMTAAKVTLAGLPITLPKLGTPIEVPGVAKVAMGAMNRAKDANHAFARITGLEITLLPATGDATMLNVAGVRAEIDKGSTNGIFQGSASALKASLLGDTVAVGSVNSGQPAVNMPCVGTKGAVVKKAIADAPLDSVGLPLDASAATSEQMGRTYTSGGLPAATGYERSWVANVNLGDGALVIQGLQSRANVTRSGKGFNTITTNANGTKAASITLNGTTVPGLSTLNGKTLSLPGLDGLVKIQTSVIEKIKSGKTIIGTRVTALRITLLDVSDVTQSVINIGNAELRIKQH